MTTVQTAALLILAQALAIYGQNQNLQQCSYVLLSSAFPGENRCLSLVDYMECLLQKLNLTAPVSESNIILLEVIVNENLANAGLECEVDVRSVVAVLHRTLPANRVPRAVSPAAGYNCSWDLGGCTNALTTQIIDDGAVECSHLIMFFKCAFRVTGFYKFQFTDQEYLDIDGQLTSLLPRLGVQCKFDFRAIVTDVASEQS